MIVLRPPIESDLSALAEIRRDRALQALLLAVHDKDLDDDSVRKWIHGRCNDPNGLFRVIADSETGVVFGFAQLTDIHHRNRIGWSGIALRSTVRGKGVGRHGLTLLHNLAREANLRKLLAYVRADNVAAQRLDFGLGYRLAGTIKSYFQDHEGNFHDVLLLDLTLSEA